jgi:hypothetical protein
MPPDQSTLTLAAIVVTPTLAAIGTFVVQERRIRHEQSAAAARLDRESKAAEDKRLRELIDDAHTAAQHGMTYLESVGPRRVPVQRQTDHYAEAVRSAAWRMSLHLGDEQALVSAYEGVIEGFNRWNDVAVGTVEAAERTERPDQMPRSTMPASLLHRARAASGAADQEWDLAREQTRESLRKFTGVARRFVGLASCSTPQDAIES